MKKLINLWCRKTEIEIENKIMYKKELKDIHKLLKQAFELQAETKFVLDYIKNVNFKELATMEHERCIEQEKDGWASYRDNEDILMKRWNDLIVLKRVFLSLDYLNQNDWTITYP